MLVLTKSLSESSRQKFLSQGVLFCSFLNCGLLGRQNSALCFFFFFFLVDVKHLIQIFGTYQTVRSSQSSTSRGVISTRISVRVPRRSCTRAGRGFCCRSMNSSTGERLTCSMSTAFGGKYKRIVKHFHNNLLTNDDFFSFENE